MSEYEINAILAKNISEWMARKDLYQQDVADALGVSQATISNWCKGVKMPRMDKIDRLCELFGCKRSDLFKDDSVIQEEQNNEKYVDAVIAAGATAPTVVTGPLHGGLVLSEEEAQLLADYRMLIDDAQLFFRRSIHDFASMDKYKKATPAETA